VIITAFKEPKIDKAILSFIHQEIPKDLDYRIIVSAPDKETQNKILKFRKKSVELFKDPGKGKSYAFNLLFNHLKERKGILIFTDGDVYANKKAVSEIISKFKDPAVGCVTGKPVPQDSRNNMFGFWAHLLYEAGAHKIRKELSDKGQFLECSGYLFAFRNNIINEIPLDVAEDAYIPYVFWDMGFKIGYADNALVYVKNPDNFKDWLEQRKRTAKAHETLGKYVDIKRVPKVKSFTNEIKKGFFSALFYPKTIKEYYWTFRLFLARFYMWMLVFYHTKIKGVPYQDAWERVESTK
jgi:biofilm PGA synthesis N-glycosyltransferase PgaC